MSARRPLHTLVQLSDPHVPAQGLLYDRVDAVARVEQALALMAATGPVDVLVLAGDAADGGDAEAYRRLRPVLEAGLGALGADLLVVPGNHDDARRLRTELLGLPPADGPQDTVLRRGGLRVVGLDSTVAGAHHGELTDDQLRRLATELADPAPDGTVLVVHHPPIWSTTPLSELVALREPDRLAAAIRGTDVRLVLSGHTHRVSAGTLAGVPVWIGPSTASASDVLAPDAFRGHPGGGFTRIDVLDDDVVTTYVPLTGRDEVLYEVRADEAAPRVDRASGVMRCR